MAENIRVAVRIRPENSAELRSSHNIVVKPLDDEGLVFDPDESFGTQSTGPNCYRRKARDVHFHFDRVFDEQATQQDIFEGTSRNILDGIFSGFNCSVLAYGATGAGKTHTMLGSEECPGLIFLIMMELYRRMDEIHEDKVCDVSISYLEVYNETIRDLLKPSKPLAVREDPQKGVVVNQLSVHKPADAHDLLRMLALGNANRTQHPTDANATSSRSHAVFHVFLQQKPRTAGLSAEVRSAKLLLVDLAGSERATVSKNRGARQREGANINRSLLALGNCINALADGNSKVHIPYRDSKLTRLLKDSLGGNCRTAFIANVSPSSLSYEDTLNTLRYAERAKKIKVKLSENRTKIDFHATRYRSIVADLQKEVAELKKRLKQPKGSDPTETSNTAAACALLERVQQETREIVNEKLSLRQHLRDIQAMQRDNITLSLRTSRLKARIQCLIPDDKRILGKLEARLLSLGQRQQELDDQYSELHVQLKANAAKWSASYSNAIASMTVLANKVKWLRPSIQQVLDARRLEVHEVEQGRELKHLRHFANSQKSDAENTETLVQQALRLIQLQNRRLTASGAINDEITQCYSSLVRTVQGAKSLAWADGQSTATTPRHCLNQSFVESSPFQKLRHHRQLLAATLQSPSSLPEDISPGSAIGASPVSVARRHEATATTAADSNETGSVSSSLESRPTATAVPMRLPTRGIMATPGTSLFRSPGETPPIRPAQPSQPTTPLAVSQAFNQSFQFTASRAPAFSVPSSRTQVQVSASPQVLADAGVRPLSTETPRHGSPIHHVPVLTSTPGIALHNIAGSGVLPPSELAFTPVISRAEVPSSQPASSASGSTANSPVANILQPAYMVATLSNRLGSRRPPSSAFFTTPTNAHRDSVAEEPGLAVEADENDAIGQAADLVLPPSPETFIIDSPSKPGRMQADNDGPVTHTAGLAFESCASSSHAFLPPPPPGLKNSRQRVRGVIDDVSRPSNIDSARSGTDDEEVVAPADRNTSDTFMITGLSSTQRMNTSNTFVVGSPSNERPASAPEPPVSSVMAIEPRTTSGTNSTKSSAGKQAQQSSTSGGSMSLSAAVHGKPQKPRPNTTGTAGRKQTFSALTASARAKQLPVRGRDENTDPHIGAPRRPAGKNGTQLEAFRARLNNSNKPTTRESTRSGRMGRQTTFG